MGGGGEEELYAERRTINISKRKKEDWFYADLLYTFFRPTTNDNDG